MEQTMKKFFAVLMSTVTFVKELHRSQDDAFFFGVCGGIAENCTIPSWILRLGFIFGIFYLGIGLVVYLGMGVLLPIKSVPKKSKTQKAIEHLERSGYIVLPKSCNGVSSDAKGWEGT